MSKQTTKIATKKLINNPDNIIEEMLEGILAAHLWQLDNHPRAIIAGQGPRKGKIGLIIGGGSGDKTMLDAWLQKLRQRIKRLNR